MGTSTARHLATVLTIGALAFLTACTPTPATPPTTPPPVETTAVPSPTADPEPTMLTVAPDALPPQLLRGDCTSAVDAATLTEAFGVAPPPRDEDPLSQLTELGAAGCSWDGDGVYMRVHVARLDSVGGADFTEKEQAFYFDGCAFYCGFEYRTDDLWVGGTMNQEGQTRESVTAAGDLIGAAIARAVGESEPWTQDRGGWTNTWNCVDVAERVSAAVSAQISGEDSGYVDPPMPIVVIADRALGTTLCQFKTEATRLNFLIVHPGGFRDATITGDDVASPVEGITITADRSGYSDPNAGTFMIHDSINVVVLEWGGGAVDGATVAGEIARYLAANA